MTYVSRDATAEDLYLVLPIWRRYVEESLLSFETSTPNYDWLKTQYSGVRAARLPYIVTFDGDRLVGWAFLRPFSYITDIVFSLNSVAESWVDFDYLTRGVGKHQQKEILQRTVGLKIRNISVLYTPQQNLSEFGLDFPNLEELGEFTEVVEKLGTKVSVKMANLTLGEESAAPKL